MFNITYAVRDVMKSLNILWMCLFVLAPCRVLKKKDKDELPDVYEPVEVDDHGEINLFQTLEDELILSLPIVALHAEEDCKQKRDEMSFGKIEPDR